MSGQGAGVRDEDFEWNDAKAASNFRKHQVTFEQARPGFDDPKWVDFDDPHPDEDRYNRLCMLDTVVYVVTYVDRDTRYASSRLGERTSMSKTSISSDERRRPAASSGSARPAMTDDEITAAALADPDAQPITPEQVAAYRAPAMCKVIRNKLGMTRSRLAEAYGIPLDTLQAWERHRSDPTEVERNYLRLIERAPELAKLEPVA